MSKYSKIVLNRSGVRQLMRSDEMEQICKELAYEAKAKLGDGYAVSSMKGKNRANASIIAVSKKAKKESKKHNTIIKAVMS